MRTPSESVARARSYTAYRVGYCLNYVWNSIASPTHFGIPDANAGWVATVHRHTSVTPPAGVPVYWGGGDHGHVAISVGGGRVRSTDYPSKGRVGEVGIDDLTRLWHLRYRGWGADFCGHAIPNVAIPTAGERSST